MAHLRAWARIFALGEGIGLTPGIAVRPARREDAAAIAEIYNQGIRGRGATFETEERTVEERERWLAGHDLLQRLIDVELLERGGG